MSVEEILRKKNYSELINALKNNPETLSPDTRCKIATINDLLCNEESIVFHNNALHVLRLYLINGLTIEKIAEELFYSPRHVDRLKRTAIEIIRGLI